jgi:hypothetical protein
MRNRVKRLERAVEEEVISIPQKDGTVRRFPQSAGPEAFVNLMARLGAGEGAPPEHPLVEAVRNSSDPEWLSSFYGSCTDPEAWTEPVEDLSEPPTDQH